MLQYQDEDQQQQQQTFLQVQLQYPVLGQDPPLDLLGPLPAAPQVEYIGLCSANSSFFLAPR